ncbi:GNAT family N-acetyltransferase [Aeromicrobium phragmitis]|uniref:GNAT family N-acetyltransferase n=1 Tax=Aeromicrobium phragmitis TaxID=2478914 RepID=A0A3L8PNH5_9ACTN|nr:GNAT family N-acetyltransferase [Aeromicrobium phragmitis]RLV56860.1 GNAT family N-acetyltransferase [Aeromicrobium phragmitis]
MTLDIRPVTEDDHDQLKALLIEAFGTMNTGENWDGLTRPGQTRWGTFVDGRLAATINHREFTSWFRGVEVPTAGVTGVSIATEFRGQRLLGPLMDELVRHARSRGEHIATLFATATGIYRARGFARIVQVANVHLPVASLSRIRGSLGLRRATEADRQLLDDLYTQWARRYDGPLTRRGEVFARPHPQLKDVHGISVVEGDDGPRGYVAWKRGASADWADSVIEVPELVALDDEAARTALAAIASFDSVASRVRLYTPGDVDPLRWLLPQNAWFPLADAEPYMLRVLDPTGLAVLPAPLGVSATLPFTVDGEGWVAHVADGRIDVERDAAARGREFAPGGLAVTFAGALPSRGQRAVGLLSGDDRDDDLWDLVFTSGRQLAIRDSF